MTRISKKNLPVFIHTARKKHKHVVLIWKKNTAILSVIIILSLLLCLCEKLGERIGMYLNDHSSEAIGSTSSFLPPISLPKSSIYSQLFGYDANEDVHSALRNTDIGNSFIQQRPEIGKLSQIKWKEDDSIVTPNAHRILLPTKLTRALKKYCLDIGLTAFARNFILSEENNIEPDGFRLVTLGDGNVWYAQRPAKKWQSDMHWISPADEKGHESYLKLLNENGFLSVLNVIGNELGLAGLVAYQLTFIVVSHCEQGFIHHDTHDTGDRTFNVIIPLETVDDSPPELIIQGTDFPEMSLGRLQYEENVGILLGDYAEHATSECDYRDKPGEMRLAATVYITDINEDNLQDVADKSLTQIFPIKDVNWLWAQRSRHWINAKISNTEVHFAGDRGRDPLFSAADEEGCQEWKEEEPSFCETDLTKRSSCPATCDVYLAGSFYESNFSMKPWLK